MKSDRIYLRPIEDEDMADLAPFFRDPDHVKYYIPTLWRTYSQRQVQGLLADWHDQSHYYVYAICDRNDDSVIGLANLDGINYVNGNTEIGIAITNEKKRGAGFAKESLSLLIDYCFNELRLHRVYCRVMADNAPSLALFEKLGFTAEGRQRDQVRREGGFVDMLFFGLLESEWRTRNN